MKRSRERGRKASPEGWVVAAQAAAVLTGLLAVYQWMELVLTLEGGQAACSIGEAFDCASVWSAPLAKAIQSWTGLPVAAWGLVWSGAAYAAATRAAWGAMRSRPSSEGVGAMRWLALAGVVSAVGLFALAMSTGKWCVTCLTTYLLVAVYAGSAYRVATLSPHAGWDGWKTAGGGIVAGFLVLLVPGLSTPVEREAQISDLIPPDPGRAPAAPSPDGEAQGRLGAFLADLAPPARQMVARGVRDLRSEAPVPASGVASRRRSGDSDAAVQITEFSDLKCGHCRRLHQALHVLDHDLDGVSVSVESRYFPLDAACNPRVPPGLKHDSAVRCLGAKVLLCLEDHPRYFELRHRFFERQPELTEATVLAWAQEVTGQSERQLRACASSPAIQEKINNDVEYAQRFGIQGTPLVVVNGRKATAAGPLLLALALADGDLRHPAFDSLLATSSHSGG